MSLVYRFRIIFEDYDDVQRDIDIKSTQNFEDLHHTIQASIGFDDKKPASFFVSNDNWKKGKEIALEKRMDKNGTPASLMKNSRLCDSISDPHQKFLYNSDYDSNWNFTMELIKIIPAVDPLKTYPACTKTVGEPPKQYVVLTPKPSAILAVDELIAEEDLTPEAEVIHANEEGVDDEELEGMNEEGEDEDLELEEGASGEDEPQEEEL